MHICVFKIFFVVVLTLGLLNLIKIKKFPIFQYPSCYQVNTQYKKLKQVIHFSELVSLKNKYCYIYIR